ncbi:NS4 protein [Mouse coronavirus]|nr:NS4 protein [Mouse coronavirus]
MHPNCKTYTTLFIGPFMVVVLLCGCLAYAVYLNQQGFNVFTPVKHSIPSASPATLATTLSVPASSVFTTDGQDYTVIKPTNTRTTVYLGYIRGFDSTTFGPKTLNYVTSSKPILNSGRPYTFKHLVWFMRPTPTKWYGW